MNQDFVKLDRFDGNNYARWKDKMMFLLTALRISYILDPELSPPPEEPRTSAEGVPPNAEEFEHDYRKKLLHKSEDFTLEQFQKHLRIEEESCKCENKVTVPVESNVHYVDGSGSQSKNPALQVRKNDEQFKKKANQDGEQKKKKGSCYGFMLFPRRQTLATMYVLLKQSWWCAVVALRALKESWQNTPPSWEKSDDPCGAPWEGVTCINSRVTSLDVSSNSLTGEIPPSLGNISGLYFLDLSGNQMSGSIPVSDSITPGLDLLKNAKHLILKNNAFNGTLDMGINVTKRLQLVDLQNNQISSLLLGYNNTLMLSGNPICTVEPNANLNSLIGQANILELLPLLVDKGINLFIIHNMLLPEQFEENPGRGGEGENVEEVRVTGREMVDFSLARKIPTCDCCIVDLDGESDNCNVRDGLHNIILASVIAPNHDPLSIKHNTTSYAADCLKSTTACVVAVALLKLKRYSKAILAFSRMATFLPSIMQMWPIALSIAPFCTIPLATVKGIAAKR
ncbi:hypothetical protein RJ639_031573 [Escallonia herrerae]|uniref:Leucine-rich repeat-containing N-terminal plant-type domain-containing protein n=1 Tax=Escallonia herrerae TaxID=1293975 RepID=A0AA88X137_9ASTE|nr:hypothetical protein RJ639_031573 [Escallonia herrerae]